MIYIDYGHYDHDCIIFNDTYFGTLHCSTSQELMDELFDRLTVIKYDEKQHKIIRQQIDEIRVLPGAGGSNLFLIDYLSDKGLAISEVKINSIDNWMPTTYIPIVNGEQNV